MVCLTYKNPRNWRSVISRAELPCANRGIARELCCQFLGCLSVVACR